ncbi:MAG: hypothetical protein Q9M33_07555 [Robiginitomaculum sp.]|nr:hypothetical protein [Robiginitomaculum sp.]MDQ7078001.1 hypothetical protein [Robiginitomaculum sp.]
MSIAMANAVASALGFYLVLGALYGLYFISFGAAAMVPAARGAGLGFRLIILPGAIMLWPVLLARLIKGFPRPEPPRPLRRLHARLWVFLVPLVALGIMMALMLRPIAPLNDNLPRGIILEEASS